MTGFTVSLRASSQTPCPGDTLTINVNIDVDGISPYTYEWTDPAGTISTDSIYSIDVSGATLSGFYEVTLTDSNATTATASVYIGLDATCVMKARCARPLCTIGGTLTHLVNNAVAPTTPAWQQYYNMGESLTNDAATAGAPNHLCIPSGMTITIGTNTLQNRTSYSDAGGGSTKPLVDSSIHYEFEAGLRITETESTMTIYYPGPIKIEASITTEKDLFIMSVAGSGGVTINGDIEARNIVITAMGGTIKVNSGKSIAAIPAYDTDYSNTVTTPSNAYISLFADHITNDGSLIVVDNGFVAMIANNSPTIGAIIGNYMVRNTSAGGIQDVYYDDVDMTISTSHDSTTCGATATFASIDTNTGSADLFINDGVSCIIVHSGPVELSQDIIIDRHVVVVTPCNITSKAIKTWTDPVGVAGNITFISGDTITVSDTLDLSPNDGNSIGGAGGICTLIAKTVAISSSIAISNLTLKASGRVLIVTANDTFVAGIGYAESSANASDGHHDLISLIAGGTLTFFIIVGYDDNTVDLNEASNSINILVGIDIISLHLNEVSGIVALSGSLGGNILSACGGSFIGPDALNASGFMYTLVGGNFFLTTGGGIETESLFVYGKDLSGRGIIITGAANPIRINSVYGDVELYYLCTPPADPSQGSFSSSVQNSNLWSSQFLAHVPTITGAAASSPRCTTYPIVLSATVNNGYAIWTLINYPTEYYDSSLFPVPFESGSSVTFYPTIVGTYVAELTVTGVICNSPVCHTVTKIVTMVVTENCAATTTTPCRPSKARCSRSRSKCDRSRLKCGRTRSKCKTSCRKPVVSAPV